MPTSPKPQTPPTPEPAPAPPLCLVLAPAGGGEGEDRYARVLRPAVAACGMEPARAGEPETVDGGGLSRVDRLLLADHVVADAAALDAAAVHALGARHAVRPGTTLVASWGDGPADLGRLAGAEVVACPPDDVAAARAGLEERLRRQRQEAERRDDYAGPVLELLRRWSCDVPHLKTDLFHARVATAIPEPVRRRIEAARDRGRAGRDDLRRLRRDLEEGPGGLAGHGAATLVDLVLAFRAVTDWDGMVELIEALPPLLRGQLMVREQYALALNRRAGNADARPDDRRRALRLLHRLEQEVGANPETNSILGRVYKDAWKEAQAAGAPEAADHLAAAADAYRRGFLADWRDAFPGINAVTLLELRGDPESLAERDRLLPAVRFAVERRLEGDTEYWDHATLVELAVLAGDPAAARRHLDDALAAGTEPWMPATTANNLSMIRQARRERGEEVGWLDELIGVLEDAGG